MIVGDSRSKYEQRTSGGDLFGKWGVPVRCMRSKEMSLGAVPQWGLKLSFQEKFVLVRANAIHFRAYFYAYVNI